MRGADNCLFPDVSGKRGKNGQICSLAVATYGALRILELET